MNAGTLRQALRQLVETLWPELSSRTHLPHKGRVVALRSTAGVAGPPGECRYSVDVEPLTPDGQPDLARGLLRDVPLDVPWIGQTRGVYALPEVGALVRVAYYDGNPAYPYIDGLLAEARKLPHVAPGELLIQQDANTYIRIAPDGQVFVKSNADVHVDGAQVILAGGGPPVARVGDQIRVSGVQPGTATIIGEIITGSPRTQSG